MVEGGFGCLLLVVGCEMGDGGSGVANLCLLVGLCAIFCGLLAKKWLGFVGMRLV